MRFTNLITAVMAVLLPITTFAAPVETQIHLHTRCEAYQVGFKKCLGVREIVRLRDAATYFVTDDLAGSMRLVQWQLLLDTRSYLPDPIGEPTPQNFFDVVY